MRAILAQATLLMAAIGGPVNAADWPCWRGPNGNGISTESNVPLKWSAEENLAWKTPLSGVGRSSPIVVGDRVFLTAGDATDLSRRVLCFDKATGAQQWNTLVHRGEPGQMHKFNTTASSTPACDGKKVYAVFIDDRAMHVAALDLNGNVAWSTSPGDFTSQHGFAASPVLFGPGVIINGQQDGAAFVVMLERETGRQLWRYQPDTNLRSFSTPLLIEFEGQPQLVITGSTKTMALDPATGQPLWSIGGPAEKFVSTPSFADGIVYSFGGSPDKKAMAVRLGGRGLLSEGDVVWRQERAMPYVPSPILIGNTLHILNDQGIYSCLDAATGQVLATGRKTGPAYSSPVAAAGRIFFFEDSGACTVIRDNSQFEVLARNELAESVYTTPAIADGSLFVRTEQSLIRIGPPRLCTKTVASPQSVVVRPTQNVVR